MADPNRTQGVGASVRAGSSRQPGRSVDTFDYGIDEPLPLRQNRSVLRVETEGPAFIELTADVADWLTQIGAGEGLLTIFVQHTSASLTIQENADPTVQADLLDALAKLAPESDEYRHSAEGADDMPAHIKALLSSVSLSVPVIGGALSLGTWQGIYLIEHRQAPHQRRMLMHFVGA